MIIKIRPIYNNNGDWPLNDDKNLLRMNFCPSS